MKFGDTISLKQTSSFLDENGDTKEESSWVTLGKCIITPNTSARQVQGEDGELFVYSYLIIMKKPAVLPVQGDLVHITKEDLSIDKDCRVSGYVVLKKRWLKIWI